MILFLLLLVQEPAQNDRPRYDLPKLIINHLKDVAVHVKDGSLGSYPAHVVSGTA